jgi:hypothetical protein
MERPLHVFSIVTFRRQSLVRRTSALLMAVLSLQLLLGADSACPAPHSAASASAEMGHAMAHHPSTASHVSNGVRASSDERGRSQHATEHCVMSLACSVAIVGEPTDDASMMLPHDPVVPANASAPASVAGALDPPPPRD